jgi:hypothetical protein
METNSTVVLAKKKKAKMMIKMMAIKKIIDSVISV